MSRFHRLNTKSATLTPQKVLQMRKDYAQGKTQGQCAKDYGISVGQVGRIVRGEAWMQVPEVPTDGDLGLTALLHQEGVKELQPSVIPDIAESIRRTKELLGEGGETKEVTIGRQPCCTYCKEFIPDNEPAETVVIINSLPAHRNCAINAGDLYDATQT